MTRNRSIIIILLIFCSFLSCNLLNGSKKINTIEDTKKYIGGIWELNQIKTEDSTIYLEDSSFIKIQKDGLFFMYWGNRNLCGIHGKIKIIEPCKVKVKNLVSFCNNSAWTFNDDYGFEELDDPETINIEFMKSDTLKILSKGNIVNNVKKGTYIYIKNNRETKTLQASETYDYYDVKSKIKSDKIIETLDETIECIIGTWESEKIDGDGYSVFKFKGVIRENRLENNIFTVEKYDKDGYILNSDSGTWDTEGVGMIRASLGGTPVGFSIKFTNCNRMVIRGRTVYIKKH